MTRQAYTNYAMINHDATVGSYHSSWAGSISWFYNQEPLTVVNHDSWVPLFIND